MAKLTVANVKNAKAGRHADGGGLYLFVKPTGARSWLLRIQVDGRRRDVGLGAVDVAAKVEGLREGHSRVDDDVPILHRKVLTLAEAREKAGLLRRFAKAGRDPIAERDKDRRESPEFAEAVKKAHEAFMGSWSKREADAFLASLAEHAGPALGKKRVDHIEAADIVVALKPIWNAKPQIARKVRQRILKVLNFAKASKWRDTEAPNNELSILLGRQKKNGGNMPSMPFADVPTYFQALMTGPETVGRLALMFVIATGARSGEVRQARWNQIDDAKKLWSRPAAIMKGGEAHVVTLNASALAVLDRVRKLRRSNAGDALVFPSPSNRTLSDMTVSKVMRDANLPFVPHGFRSSFRDWAAEKMPQMPDAVAEAALAHKVSDKVIAAYKRTTFLELRKELLDGWAAYLARDESEIS